MKQKDIDQLIELAGIRPSPVRILLLRALDNADGPLSSQELEEILETVNRSSITRTLSLFTKVGIVHSVEDGSGAVRYEICHAIGSSDHQDLHPHFHCTICGKTYCFENVPIPQIDIPKGYVPASVNFVIKGTCPECVKRCSLKNNQKAL